MNGLQPEKWMVTTIDEVTTNTTQRQPQQDESFVYIDIGSIYRETKRISDPQRLVGQNAPSRARKVVQTGDVLVSTTRPNLNAVAMVPEELNNQIASTGFDVLRASIIDPRWLFYIVRTTAFIEAMSELVQGALYPAVRPRDIRSFEIPLAPLNEQKRIADKLARLLTRVDACRSRCDRIPLILKRFRQSVLAAATSGELTEDWREENPDIESASDFLVRLQEQFRGNFIHRIWSSSEEKKSGTLPESWLYAPVEALGEVYLGRQRSPKNHNGPNMRPYVRAANITWAGWNFSDVKEMNFDSRDFERYRLQIGDVLINEGSGSADEVGKPAIWRGEIENCCFQNTLICVRPFEDMSEYLYLVFLHTALSKAFVEATRGVNIHHIGKERFAAFLIPLPPFEEQQEIVRRVEKLFAFADRLEARYKTARVQVDRLTPALLDQAFQGELVPQDPNDEPASALLKRIHVERSQQAQGKTKQQEKRQRTMKAAST